MSKVKIIKNSTFNDHRGYYWTTWKKNTLKEIKFNHDKFSISRKKVLRGLHCDFKSWKLVTCVFGKIFFVVVNMKKDSKKHFPAEGEASLCGIIVDCDVETGLAKKIEYFIYGGELISTN